MLHLDELVVSLLISLRSVLGESLYELVIELVDLGGAGDEVVSGVDRLVGVSVEETGSELG